MLVLAMVLAAEPVNELHFYPSQFDWKTAAPAAEPHPSGKWYEGMKFELSPEYDGRVVFNGEPMARLLVVEKKSGRVTDDVLVARHERAQHVYEKTSNAWLTRKGKGWELVISEFLEDFEREDPRVPGTKNITGTKSSVHAFKRGKFEFVSEQLPPKRDFSIKR